MGDLSGEFFGSSSESASEGLFDSSSEGLVDSASEASSAGADGSATSSDGSSAGTPRRPSGPGDPSISDGDLRDIPPRKR